MGVGVRVGGLEFIEREVELVAHSAEPQLLGCGGASTRWLGRVGLVVQAAKGPSGARR